jgi:hypothetical protein
MKYKTFLSILYIQDVSCSLRCKVHLETSDGQFAIICCKFPCIFVHQPFVIFMRSLFSSRKNFQEFKFSLFFFPIWIQIIFFYLSLSFFVSPLSLSIPSEWAPLEQGDQIGRIFVIGRLLTLDIFYYRSRYVPPLFVYFFHMKNINVFILAKRMRWATFWAIFSPAHLATLLWKLFLFSSCWRAVT